MLGMSWSPRLLPRVTPGASVRSWSEALLQATFALVLVTATTGRSHAQATPVDGVVKVFAGGAHSCLLSSVGELRCFGRNVFGQLGSNGISDQSNPVPVAGQDPVIASAALGESHSCSLSTAGAVRCWGRNDVGQLGDGQSSDRSVPVNVQTLGSGVTAIASGHHHNCALIAGGAARCWGLNTSGQLGDGTSTNRRSPVAISSLGVGVRSLALGRNHSCALTMQGRVMCWGMNSVGQLGDGTTTARTTPGDVSALGSDIQAIAAGDQHTCALKTNGQVLCWGSNNFGQLGQANTGTEFRTTPVAATSLGAEVLQVIAGTQSTCAIHRQGSMSCSGRNDRGQVGDGTTAQRNTFVTVQLGESSVASASAGAFHVCAQTLTNGAICWGDNSYGQLGDGNMAAQFAPVRVQGLTGNLRAIATGDDHACAITELGAVQCWGDNTFGQIGDGTTIDRQSPTQVIGLTQGVTSLAAGTQHNCAALSTGRVMCWGINQGRQLGDGSTNSRSLPVEVAGLSGAIRTLVAGGDFSCAALQSGTVKCWGSNESGQLGNGTTIAATGPVDVVGLTGTVVKLTAGVRHACAQIGTGEVRCWGLNSSGQIGDGTTTSRPTATSPVQIGGPVASVGAGLEHTCVTRADGTVRCWGRNQFGQLGDGTTQSRSSPVTSALPDSGGAIGVAGGFRQTCALLRSGAIRCWGRNDNAELGNGTTLTQLGVSAVLTLDAGATALALGSSHGCASIQSEGALCWGSDIQGQVGDGGRNYSIPAPVLDDAASLNASLLASDVGDDSINPASSGSGDIVVFQAKSASIVSGDSNASFDIFRMDTRTRSVARVSLDNSGRQLSGDSTEPSISADGNLVAFVAPDSAVDVVSGEDFKAADARRKGGAWGVYMRNVIAGTTQRMGTASPNGTDTKPQLSADGTALAYSGLNTSPGLGATDRPEILLVEIMRSGDTTTVGSTRCVSCKSIDGNGRETSINANGASYAPALSANGDIIAWETAAKNSVAANPSTCVGTSTQVILRNMLTGSAQRMSTLSADATCSPTSSGNGAPSLDWSGETLVVESDQAIESGDSNGVADVYMFDTQADSVERISQSGANVAGNGASIAPRISGDGNVVSFLSEARNLEPAAFDNNEIGDVHIYTRSSGMLRRVTKTPSGDQVDAASGTPIPNYDGSSLAFDSGAEGLGVSANATGLFVRDNPSLSGVLRSALWWKSDESGWGISVFDQGGVLAPAWFTYDIDGEPTWFLIAGAFEQADGSYLGDLYRLRGQPFDQLVANAVESTTLLGQARIRFLGASEMEFRYTVDGQTQTKRVSRFPFGPRTFSCRATSNTDRTFADNYSDIWYGGETATGWGLVLSHVDDNLYAGWYTYDRDREAVFFVSIASRQSDGAFRGQLFRQRNGTPFSQINGAPASSGSDPVGTATFRFENGSEGLFSYTLGNVSQSRPITRLQIGNTSSTCRSTALQ